METEINTNMNAIWGMSREHIDFVSYSVEHNTIQSSWGQTMNILYDILRAIQKYMNGKSRVFGGSGGGLCHKGTHSQYLPQIFSVCGLPNYDFNSSNNSSVSILQKKFVPKTWSQTPHFSFYHQLSGSLTKWRLT